MSTQVRQRIERELAQETIRVLLAAGYVISVDDGDDDYLVMRSSDPEQILLNMFQMDDDRLYVRQANDTTPGYSGWVYFVWGNCGHDALSDHTMNLEATLKPVFELADRLEKEYGDQ